MKVILPILSKTGYHGNVPSGIGRRGPDRLSMNKYLSFSAKIAKIGPAKINASKIYSPVGKFAERAKKLCRLLTMQ